MAAAMQRMRTHPRHRHLRRLGRGIEADRLALRVNRPVQVVISASHGD